MAEYQTNWLVLLEGIDESKHIAKIFYRHINIRKKLEKMR
jgi:hypothetical protein